MGKLNVRTSDDLNRMDNIVGIFLKTLLQIRRNRQHGSRAIGVSGMDSHGIYIFNKTDCDHLVLGVTNYLKLQFLPSEDRFLDQDLTD